MDIKKVTLDDLRNDKNWEEAVIVFSNESWGRDYELKSRSYEISRDAKYFDADMIGNSLYGSCLDGTDNGVRLDKYMSLLPEEGRRWVVEYCYVTETNKG